MSTRKNLPWRGWSKEKPSRHQRTVMMRKCGNKCFLGPNKSFPICKKNTCKISQKGVYAAYVRAREWGSTKRSSFKGRSHPKYSRKTYKNIAKKAYKMLK
jgi:hypothetical protein